MKSILFTITIIFSFNSWASTPALDQLDLDQKVQLLQLLNQMDHQVLENLLSDEALDWYIGQFQRTESVPQTNEEQVLYEVIQSGFDNGIGHFKDPFAPKYK